MADDDVVISRSLGDVGSSADDKLSEPSFPESFTRRVGPMADGGLQFWQLLAAAFLLFVLGVGGNRPQPYKSASFGCKEWPCDGDLRLVSGQKPSEGRLEFYHEGQWGTICDNGWKEENAKVACKQLGYSLGGKTKSFPPGPADSVTWFDMTSCYGYERRLADCPHGPWKVRHCVNLKDIGISCYTHADVMTLLGRCPDGAEEGDLRLVGGPRRREGIVQLNHDCEWGTICAAGWLDQEKYNLAVVCRQLGRAPGVTTTAMSPGRYGRANGTIWTSWVQCSGSERYLTQCTNTGLGIEYCKSHNYDVGVRCGRRLKPPRRKPSFRDILKEDSGKGQLDIFNKLNAV